MTTIKISQRFIELNSYLSTEDNAMMSTYRINQYGELCELEGKIEILTLIRDIEKELNPSLVKDRKLMAWHRCNNMISQLETILQDKFKQFTINKEVTT